MYAGFVSATAVTLLLFFIVPSNFFQNDLCKDGRNIVGCKEVCWGSDCCFEKVGDSGNCLSDRAYMSWSEVALLCAFFPLMTCGGLSFLVMVVDGILHKRWKARAEMPRLLGEYEPHEAL